MFAKRLQIALEFMIVFAFVLLVFLFLFVLISSQRAQTLNTQVFSEEQVIAQSVSAQMDRALQAGNGYSARVPLTGAIGTLNYQLSITKNGAVIVNASVGNEALQAVAYSSAKKVVSNPAYLQAHPLYYTLPISNGTLSIQNSYGTLCIDYQCQAANSNAGNVSLSAKVTHVALFQGVSFVQGNANALPYGKNAISMLAWIRTNASSRGTIFSYGTTSTPGWGATMSVNEGSPNGDLYIDFWNDQIDSGVKVNDGKWHLVGFSVPAGSTSLTVFVDNSAVSATLPLNPVVSPSTKYQIGRWIATGTGDDAPYGFNGLIADVQVYNGTLQTGMVRTLFTQGIGSAPTATNNLVGWWSLNGDTNDYSGNSYNGFRIGGIIYPTAAELFARVRNLQGYPLSGALVGFTSTLGNFTASDATTNVTNANGIAIAYLTQQQNNGAAIVSATAFNGNQSLQSGLVSWWLLASGRGNAAPDASGNGNAGTFGKNVGWSNPALVASFSNSTVVIPPSSSLQLTSQTWSFWFYSSTLAASQRILGTGMPQSASNPSGIEAYINGRGYLAFNSMGQSCTSTDPVLNSTWYHAAATWNTLTSTFSCYLNGMLENSVNSGFSGSITSKNAIYLGTDSFTPARFFFNGDLANLQIYGAALSPSQIIQLYDQGIASTPLNPAGWWPLDGDANDYSLNGNNGTSFGNVNFASAPISAYANNNATALLTAGVTGNGFVQTPLTQNSIGAFTITAWVNPASNSKMSSLNGYSVFNSFGSSNFQLWLSDNGLLGSVPGSGDEELGIGSGNHYWGYGISNNSWNFIAVAIASGNPSGKASIYANGAQPYNISIVRGPYSINGLAIGQAAQGVSAYNGLITDVQVYNSTLNASQVQQIFQQGIAGVPLNTTGMNFKLLAWYPLYGNAKDYSVNGNNATSTNVVYTAQSAARQAVPVPLAGTGANFNGQNSYISVPSSYTLRQPGIMALNAWVRINGTPQSATPFVVDSSGNMCSGCGGYALTLTNYTVPVFTIGDNSGFYTDNSMRRLNSNWHMLTGVYNSTALTIYIDGVATNVVNHSGTITYTSSCPGSGIACGIAIGSSSDPATHKNGFSGSIADVQLYSNAPSAAQVAALYQGGVPPRTSLTIPMSWYP